MSKFKSGTVEENSQTIGLPTRIEPTPIGFCCTAFSGVAKVMKLGGGGITSVVGGLGYALPRNL